MSREAAELAREAASVIEKYGHYKNGFGNDEKGFCLYGALGMAQGHVKSYALNWEGREVTTATPDRTDPRLDAVRNLIDRKLNLPEYVYESMPGAAEFNDRPETTGKDVQKFLLQLADELEVQ